MRRSLSRALISESLRETFGCMRQGRGLHVTHGWKGAPVVVPGTGSSGLVSLARALLVPQQPRRFRAVFATSLLTSVAEERALDVVDDGPALAVGRAVGERIAYSQRTRAPGAMIGGAVQRLHGEAGADL